MEAIINVGKKAIQANINAGGEYIQVATAAKEYIWVVQTPKKHIQVTITAKEEV